MFRERNNRISIGYVKNILVLSLPCDVWHSSLAAFTRRASSSRRELLKLVEASLGADNVVNAPALPQ